MIHPPVSTSSLCHAHYPLVACCFTSTETVGLLETGAQDGHLDFHTAPELCLSYRSSALLLSVHRNRRLNYQGWELRPSTSTFTQLLISDPFLSMHRPRPPVSTSSLCHAHPLPAATTLSSPAARPHVPH